MFVQTHGLMSKTIAKKSWWDAFGPRDLYYTIIGLFTVASLYWGIKIEIINLKNDLVLMNYRITQLEGKKIPANSSPFSQKTIDYEAILPPGNPSIKNKRGFIYVN